MLVLALARARRTHGRARSERESPVCPHAAPVYGIDDLSMAWHGVAWQPAEVSKDEEGRNALHYAVYNGQAR